MDKEKKSNHFPSTKCEELRNWLRSKQCDQLLFGSGAPSSMDDFSESMSTEFCSAIKNIANRPPLNEMDRADVDELLAANGATYDWNEKTQDFSIRAYEQKDVEVDVVEPKIKKSKAKMQEFCAFCKNNDEPESVYKSHPLRDIYKRAVCSRLRAYVCPICHESGDNAHTVKYCPKKRILTMEDICGRNYRKRSH